MPDIKKYALFLFFAFMGITAFAQSSTDSIPSKERISYLEMLTGAKQNTIAGKNKLDINLSLQRLEISDLDSIFDNALPFIRNEIYARHGYIFGNSKYKEHFEKQEWYMPVSNNALIKLNAVEKQNAAFIKQVEDKRMARRGAIKTYFEKEKLRAEKDDKNLSSNLEKINMDSIKYCGNRGYYSKMEYFDEGKVLERKYSISIAERQISISCIFILVYPNEKDPQSSLMSPRGGTNTFYINEKNHIEKSEVYLSIN